MAWKIELTKTAEKELTKINKSDAKRIFNYLKKRVAVDPRSSGKTLRGNHSGFWRYRIGDYRVICEIYDDKISVLVIRVGHRKNIYR